MNTKRITIIEFRKIREQMNNVASEIRGLEDDESDKEIELFSKYLELQNKLLSYNLSDIPFEEWKGYIIFSTDDIKADFSKTQANLDFGIIECYGNLDLRGCRVRGLENIDSRSFSTNTYDDRIIADNPNVFLSDSFSKEFREKFYNCTLLIEDIALLNESQLAEVKDKNLLNHLEFSERNSYLLKLIDLDTAILFCQQAREDFLAVKEVLSSYKYDLMNSNELSDSLKNTDYMSYKDVCFNFLRNEVINSGRKLNIDDYPELFISENKNLFLIDVDVSNEVRERYYDRKLTITDLIDNKEVFKNIPVDYCLDLPYGVYSCFRGIYQVGEFQEIVFRHPDFFNNFQSMEEMDSFFTNYFRKTDDEELEKRLVMAVKESSYEVLKRDKEIPEYLDSFNFQLVDKIEDREELLNCSENTIVLDDNQKRIINILGIDNVKRFEEETGFFFHKYTSGDNFFEIFDYIGVSIGMAFQAYMPARNYEESLSRLASCLDYLRVNYRCDIDTYDWLEGDFRREHPEIFMDKEAPIELRKAFYRSSLKAEMIKNNPDYVNYLMDKNLVDSLKLSMYLDIIRPISDNDSVLKSLGLTEKSETVDFVSAYTEKFGNKAFLDLVIKYGSYLNFLHVDSKNGEIDNKEEIEKCLRRGIALSVANSKTNYSNLAQVEEFKEDFPEMFINLDNINILEDAKKEIEMAFYSGKMSFEYFNKYPELVNAFQGKFLTLGFRGLPFDFQSRYDRLNNLSSNGPIGKRLSPRITLDNLVSKELDINSVFNSMFVLNDNVMMELGMKYGKYLDSITSELNYHIRENEDNLNINMIDSMVEEIITRRMTMGTMSYNEEDVPEYFITKYPELFLDKDVDSELKDKFYNKEMEVNDILSNYNSYLEIFKDTSITGGLDSTYNWINALFKGVENANIYRLKVLVEYEKIKSDSELALEFKDYLLNSDSINIGNIEVLGNILDRLSKTNSTSLHSVRKTLVKQLLQLDNPIDSYNRIEKVFLKNNLPLYGKMFYCFEILYPDFTKGDGYGNVFDFSENSRLSPELKDDSLAKVRRYDGKKSDTDKRFQIIYNDLVRIAVKSNSLDLRNYLNSLDKGQDLFYRVIDNGEKLSDLSEEDIDVLNILEMHLEMLYSATLKGKEEKLDLAEYDLLTKLEILVNKIHPTSRYDLKDRIVRMFAYSAGYHSYQELRDEMDKSIREADVRGRSYAKELESVPFRLEDGDFLRCIGDYQALGGSLDNGNLSKEFLSTIRGTSDSDTTPLDIDWTLVEDRGDIYHSVASTPTGFGFGNVYIVIKKDNPNIRITRDKDGNLEDSQYDPKTIEMFGTKVGDGGYHTHWGSRTGIALTDVDYILYKKTENINHENPYLEDGSVNYEKSEDTFDDLGTIKFEVARHGFYIPIVDFTGKNLFSVEEYEMLREQIKGLSHYGEDGYTFSNSLDIPSLEVDGNSYPAISEITEKIDESAKLVALKREKIMEVLQEVFTKYNLDIKTTMDGDLTPGTIEIIDTGSTGRNTNEIGEGDFDLLFRLDSDIFENEAMFREFREDVMGVLDKHEIKESNITSRDDIRYKGVKLEDGVVVDIDITYDRKTDKVLYTTDECIRDRLATLKELDEDKYKQVLANIILAKRVLKDGEVYKSRNSAIAQGGLGGVGVENWILQHGGSFIEAAKSFMEASEGRSFDEFKKVYSVWDFGENHTSERKGHYPHDNFIADNMSIEGYDKMKNVLASYLRQYEMRGMFDKESYEETIDRQLV